MAKVKTPFDCAIFCKDPTLSTIISDENLRNNGNIIILKSNDDVIKCSKQIVFVDEDLLDPLIFKNEELLTKIEEFDLLLVIIGSKKSFQSEHYYSSRIDKSELNNKTIEILIKKWYTLNGNVTKRDLALNKKLTRLFFIYHLLEQENAVSLDYLINKTGFSKRTIQRDIKTLRDVVVSSKIEFNEENKTYEMTAIFKMK